MNTTTNAHVLTATTTNATSNAATTTRHLRPVRLADTRALSRQEWLQVRNQGIGSSDAAAAIGLSPFKSPLELWLEKTGRKEAPDLADNEAVFWGSTLEPVIAEVYQERTGQRVRRVNAVLQHPGHAFMLANVDRAVGSDGLLEIKTAGARSAAFWEEGVPLAYQCQVLHQLAVTGKAWADVAVLIAGQDLRIYRVERDEVRIQRLIHKEAQFWGHVSRDEPPPVDGSASSGSALRHLYASDDGGTLDLTESDALNRVFHELLNLKRERQCLEFIEETHRQTLQAAIGSASGAVFRSGRVSWKKSRDGTSLDARRLAAEHPELAQQYAMPAPGIRRFLIQVDKPAPATSAAPLPAPDSAAPAISLPGSDAA